MVSEDLGGAERRWASRSFVKAFASLRPYGGMACLPMRRRTTGARCRTVVAETARRPRRHGRRLDAAVARRAAAGRRRLDPRARRRRQHARLARPLVKAPLGLLWFGGPSHDGILPRHGHGPQPQVVDGRLFIEGVDMLRAVDVYTGRLLWETGCPASARPTTTPSTSPAPTPAAPTTSPPPTASTSPTARHACASTPPPAAQTAVVHAAAVQWREDASDSGTA